MESVIPGRILMASVEDENCTNEYNPECIKAEAIGYYIGYTPVCVIGIPLNIFNILVLSKAKFKLNGSTFTYLTAMAVADLSTLVLAWPMGLMRCLPLQHEWQHRCREFYEIYLFMPIVNTFATISVWITVAVSIERWIFIGKSLTARSLCTKTYAARVIAFLSIGALAVNFPYFFHRTPSSDPHEVVYTDWSLGSGYTAYTWCRMFLVKLIPITLVAVFNCMLLKAVYDANKRRKTMVAPLHNQAQRHKRQVRTTGMLITISCIFLLCHFLEPFIHSGIYSFLFGVCALYDDGYAIFRMVVNTLEMFSFASNFIVYCIFNRQFLVALALICHCKSKDSMSNSTLQDVSTVQTTVRVRENDNVEKKVEKKKEVSV